jgi:hypothetical protein
LLPDLAALPEPFQQVFAGVVPPPPPPVFTVPTAAGVQVVYSVGAATEPVPGAQQGTDPAASVGQASAPAEGAGQATSPAAGVANASSPAPKTQG